jgi:sterol desaturase/sphingolipid hydroxylase (fatty acid hydroxylase superfamily)
MNLFQSHFISYWCVSIGFYIADLIVYKTKTVELYKQNKITEEYWKYTHDSAKAALCNQILTYLILTNFEKNIIIKNFDIRTELIRLLLYYILADLYFFTVHYTAHRVPFIYKKIHKFHHRIFSTSAVSALDANPLEHILVNIGSFFVGPIVVLGHINTIKLWLTVASIMTCVAHSGYKHFLVGKEHNTHHRFAKYNYGQGLYLCDRLFGTYKGERDFVPFKP